MPDLDLILQRLESGAQTEVSPPAAHHTTVKLAVTGPSQTGKSSLCQIYLQNNPAAVSPYNMTIGMALHHKTMPVGGTVVHLNIMDCSGQAYYQSLLRPLVAAADAYFFIFDLTRRETMDALRKQVYELVSMNPNFNGVVVGSRSDLVARRQVTAADGAAFAATFRLPYLETNIKDKSTISECFRLVGRAATERLDVAVKGGVQPADAAFPQAPPRVKKKTDAPTTDSLRSDKGKVALSNDDDEF